jgi:ribonuclease HII
VAPSGDLEAALRARGFAHVAGVDEAGRGALAGPLVAAAVVLPDGWCPEGLDDSKLVSPPERERLYDEIQGCAIAVGVHRIGHELVDRKGLQRANLLALRHAIRKLEPQPDYTLVDGFALNRTAMPCLRLVKGDGFSASIAAASIIAKVTRDRMMVRAARRYPGYGFASNKGYRAPEHLAALDRLGPCALHRRSFAPVAAQQPVGRTEVR